MGEYVIFARKRMELDPQTHIYFELLSPGDCLKHIRNQLILNRCHHMNLISISIWPCPFLYLKKSRKWYFCQKREWSYPHKPVFI